MLCPSLGINYYSRLSSWQASADGTAANALYYCIAREDSRTGSSSSSSRKKKVELGKHTLCARVKKSKENGLQPIQGELIKGLWLRLITIIEVCWIAISCRVTFDLWFYESNSIFYGRRCWNIFNLRHLLWLLWSKWVNFFAGVIRIIFAKKRLALLRGMAIS